MMVSRILWVRSFSFPWSTRVCPWYVRIALTSFKGLTRVSALLVEWVTWGWPEMHDVTTRGRVWSFDKFLSGGHLSEHRGLTQGSLSNAHPMIVEWGFYILNYPFFFQLILSSKCSFLFFSLHFFCNFVVSRAWNYTQAMASTAPGRGLGAPSQVSLWL